MKKKFLSILLIIGLIASLSVAFVACDDDDTKGFVKGLSAREAAVAFMSYDITSATFIYSNTSETHSYTSTIKVDSKMTITEDVVSNGANTDIGIVVSFVENGKVYELVKETTTTASGTTVDKDYSAIDLEGATFKNEPKIKEYEAMFAEMLLSAARGNTEYTVETGKDSVVITYSNDDYNLRYELKDINKTKVSLPEGFDDYKDNAVNKNNGYFSSSYDYDLQKNYYKFCGVKYKVDSYKIPEQFEDIDVTEIELYSDSAHTLETLIIPKTITSIVMIYNFEYIDTIVYEGTKAEFEAIDYATSSECTFVVKCSDGDLTINITNNN